ncbi:MAG: DegV family protein [Dehalococcoidia bacterium]
MPDVAVVTDSTACLPRELVQEYGIRVVPLTFIFGDVSYKDDPDLDIEEFYRRLEGEKTPPATSPASPGTYLEVFRELSQQARGILCITVASRISGMFEAARVAKEMAGDSLPEVQVRVMDSGTAAMAQGFVARAAARAAKCGDSLEGVWRAAADVKSRVELIAMVDTLSYLARSGRIPRVGAWAASVVGLKPILTIKDGHVKLASTSRNSQRAMEKMLKVMQERTGGKGDLHVSVIHANVPSKAEQFKTEVQQRVKCVELFVARFSPVMGIYTGPGVLGLVYYSEG